MKRTNNTTMDEDGTTKIDRASERLMDVERVGDCLFEREMEIACLRERGTWREMEIACVRERWTWREMEWDWQGEGQGE